MRFHMKQYIITQVGSSKKVSFICLHESPLKMMKDAFYLILKAFIVLKIFEWLSWLLGCVEKKKCLIRQIRLFSKFMTSQSTITIYILSNISRSKGNQTMKFDQVIEHNKRKKFPQKSWRRWGKESSSTPCSALWKTFI